MRRDIEIDQIIVDEWKQLGFYYDFDSRIEVNQWRFYGSKKGLQKFVSLIEDYINNIDNSNISEHMHYGPYNYLKILTWDKAVITNNYIAGTISDLKNLLNIISNKLNNLRQGDTFNIDNEYGIDNTASAKCFIMADDFDPASMDELIVSGRQKIVNAQLVKKKDG